MSLKYNMSNFTTADNPVLGMIIESNNASAGFFIYMLLLIVFIVSAYVINRKTQDVQKSLLFALHITMLPSLLLFYLGKKYAVTFIPEILMLFILIVEAIAIAGMYYTRTNNN